jgi:low affinity Fe/Cu permease
VEKVIQALAAQKAPSREGAFFVWQQADEAAAPQVKQKCKKPSRLNRVFVAWAERASSAAGSPVAFMLASSSVIVWAATGPMFDFSETWQIVINTATTIVTFLLVFLIQNSQNRETRALQLKLDELIRATSGAQNTMLNLEKLSDEELQTLCEQYEKLAQAARQEIERGKVDADGNEDANREITASS